jgi:hypothetical protein
MSSQRPIEIIIIILKLDSASSAKSAAHIIKAVRVLGLRFGYLACMFALMENLHWPYSVMGNA